MLTENDVINAYRYILGREPESEQAIVSHLSLASIQELRHRFIESAEFENLYGGMYKLNGNIDDLMPPQDLPLMHVDVDADQLQLQKLLNRIRSEWESFGKEEPHWSVITHDSYKKQYLDDDNIKNFFQSGLFVVKIIKAFFKRNNLYYKDFENCLELGCGVGRITLHLSDLFQHVVGLDISKFHIDICREELHRKNIHNVSLSCINNVEQLKDISDFDFFCSFIVLQHNPPPVIKLLLECFLKKLTPGGVAIFQVPTYQKSYCFNLSQYLENPSPLTMEMHVLPQPHVFSIIKQSNCELLEVREDGWAEGRSSNSLSNTFFVMKQRR